MTQCKCKTDDGSRCKRDAEPNSKHGYCWQHNSSQHSKMRCVSLARKSIGFHSPKRRPSPRKHLKKSKKIKKSTK